MRLTLAVLRCPNSASPETRVVPGGDYTIGRGPDNDWVVPDPDKHLSKRHCSLSFRGGDWMLSDLSSNGTFVNGEAEALGQGRTRALRQGDRVRFGAYEVEVQLAATTQAVAGMLDPFGTDAFQAPYREEAPLRQEVPARASIGLPADYDPMAPDQDREYQAREYQDRELLAPTQSDHSPATSDAFQLPPVTNSLPDDWADDLLPKPQDALPVMVAPVLQAPAPPPAQPLPPAPIPVAGPDLAGAFLKGAGLEGTTIADPMAMMESVGQVIRELVTGLRQVLMARAAVKSEFRIEQTMISARGNNPLKFAADDDDALAALIGEGRRTAMPGPAAVADALRDLRLHELATMAAMQAAVRALIGMLDPAELSRGQDGGLSLALQKKARAWDAFVTLHGQLTRSLGDDFDSVFGKGFARAYEQAEADLDQDRKR